MNTQPDSAAKPLSISAGDLSERIASGKIFVLDVRRHPGSEQIFGSIRYNPRHLLDAERLVLPLPKDGEIPIVLYDESGEGPDLGPLAAKFRQSGYGEVAVLAGGFDGWKAAARRTEELSLEQPIPTVEEQQLGR